MSIVQRDRIFFAEGGAAVYEEIGRLRCTACNPDPMEPQWCDHIKDVIESGDDAGLTGMGEPGFMSVPVFPVETYYINVTIDDEVIAGGRKIFATIDDDRRSPDSDVFIGFLMPGEGRKIVRAMLLDWAKPQFDPSRNQCKSRKHGVAAERIVQQMLADPKQKMVHAWSIVTDGLCKPCRDREDEYDFSASVPDGVF